MQQRSEKCIQWFKQEQSRLLAYLCTRMPTIEDAELLLTDTARHVLRAVEHGHLHTDADSLLRYTLRLLYCGGCNALRQQKRRKAREQKFCRELYTEPYTPHMLHGETDDTQLAARRAVYTLPPEQREAVVLLLWQELTPSQAASVLHIPLSTLKSRYQTALRRLKDILTSHPDIPQ